MSSTDFFRKKMAYWAQVNAALPTPPDHEIWYWADEQVTLYTTTGVLEHTFANGKGVLKFADAITTVEPWLRGTKTNEVKLPKTATALANYAFASCSYLFMELPEGLEAIGNNCFLQTNVFFGPYPTKGGLYRSYIPASVKQIGGSAFARSWNFEWEIYQVRVYMAVIFLGTPDSIDRTAFKSNGSALQTIAVPWPQGAVKNAPWGASSSVSIVYDSTPTT